MTQPLFRLELENQSAVNAMHAIMDEYARARKGACEYSGRVRNAFRGRGHDAWSCDLLDSEDGSRWHIKGDVLWELTGGWDLMIAHPPCTHLAVSGARWWPNKLVEQEEALGLVRVLMGAPIPRICIENPISKISTAIRKPDQIIQPWQFGHGETKAIWAWRNQGHLSMAQESTATGPNQCCGWAGSQGP